MHDDEMEMWRQQWQGQPSAVVDLIRRVERETVEMRMAPLALFAPAAVGFVATVFVAMSPSLGGILFVAGLWLFGTFTLLFIKWNYKGAWTPQAETTTAYLELSILRCRRKLRDFRVGRVMAVLVTAFVLAGVYLFLRNVGALKTALGYWITVATFVWTIAIVAIAMIVGPYRMKGKTHAELEYLLSLQRQLLRPEEVEKPLEID
jgi:hypothetical protein